MKFYLDTEFLQDGHTIDLISIGIVAEDGAEYYAVNEEAPWERIRANEWLMANVVPALGVTPGGPTHPDLKLRSDIRKEVMTFLLRHNDGTPIELWGWYSGFDYVVFSQLFGTMTDYPSSLPQWINDLRQETERLGAYDLLPKQEEGPRGIMIHNALNDARWNKQVGEFLIQHAASETTSV